MANDNQNAKDIRRYMVDHVNALRDEASNRLPLNARPRKQLLRELDILERTINGISDDHLRPGISTWHEV